MSDKLSRLRPAAVGPIVGHVTATSARIWIRGEDPADAGVNIARHRRTVGVIAIRKVGKKNANKAESAAFYFRLQREFDRTGVFTFGVDADLGKDEPSPPLQADTRYEVRVGTLTVDDPHPDAESIEAFELAHRLPPATVWLEDLDALPKEMALACFETDLPNAAEQGDLSFLLGSCRYPGLLWKAKHADKIFGPMLAEAEGPDGRAPVQFALMVGDQIYADKLNRKVELGLADTFEEFQERYLSAYGSPRMRALLRQLPTYMILDDHEIEDNWTQDRIKYAESRGVFNLAITAYMSYQWLHGPRSYGRRLYYDFAWRKYPFFVLDTRTQRYMDGISDELSDNCLLGRPSLAEEEPNQLGYLLHWLRTQQDERENVPKFIVTSSVFAPNPMDAREGREGTELQKVRWKEASDSWPAFPSTRRAILECIVEHPIQNVVFLSGDIHCSNVAQLEFSGSAAVEKLKAFSITSSAFYWPFPFADGDPSGYVHDSRAENQRDTFRIRNDERLDYKAWNFTQEDNFCRIDVDRQKRRITVVPYDDEGDQIESGGFLGIGAKPLKAELDLAEW